MNITEKYGVNFAACMFDLYHRDAPKSAETRKEIGHGFLLVKVVHDITSQVISELDGQ